MHTIQAIPFTVENTEITVFIENNFVYKHDRLYSAPHLHSLHEIYIVLEGDLIVNPQNEKTHFLSCNEGCVFPPLSYHNSISVSNTNTKRLALKFIFKKIKTPNNEVDLYGILNYALNFSEDIIKFNVEQNIINDIISHSKNLNDSFNVIILKNIFSLIFIKIAEQNQPAFSKLKNVDSSAIQKQFSSNPEATLRLIKLDRYLEMYTNGKITFPQIAKKLFISTKQLSRIITENYKIPPKNFLFEYKMKRAEFFLSETPFSIKDVAEFIGYSSPNTFTILFKKYTNMSPTEYRRNTKLIKRTFEPKSSP